MWRTFPCLCFYWIWRIILIYVFSWMWRTYACFCLWLDVKDSCVYIFLLDVKDISLLMFFAGCEGHLSECFWLDVKDIYEFILLTTCEEQLLVYVFGWMWKTCLKLDVKGISMLLSLAGCEGRRAGGGEPVRVGPAAGWSWTSVLAQPPWREGVLVVARFSVTRIRKLFFFFPYFFTDFVNLSEVADFLP